MTEPTPPRKPNANREALPADAEHTVDLTMEEFGEVDDLQALADQMADYDPEAGEDAGKATGTMAREDLETELDRTRARVAALEKAETEQRDKHHRLLADFTNHRNRVGRETSLAVSLAERKLLMEVLPVLDSFERCLSSTYTSLEDFNAGVLLIQKQLQEALRKAGVEALPVKVGDPFDAQNSEALTTANQPGLPDGSVAAIYERGYMLREHLLRPARVIVNHNPDGIANPS